MANKSAVGVRSAFQIVKIWILAQQSSRLQMNISEMVGGLIVRLTEKELKKGGSMRNEAAGS